MAVTVTRQDHFKDSGNASGFLGVSETVSLPGTAETDRVFLIFIHEEEEVSNVTLDGNSMTLITSETTNSAFNSYAYRYQSSTLSGNVDLEYDIASGSNFRQITVYVIDGLGSPTPHDSGTGHASNASSVSTTLDVPDSGVVVASSWCEEGFGAPSFSSYTGVTLDGTDSLADFDDYLVADGSEKELSSETGRSIQTDWGDSYDYLNIIAVSFEGDSGSFNAEGTVEFGASVEYSGSNIPATSLTHLGTQQSSSSSSSPSFSFTLPTAAATRAWIAVIHEDDAAPTDVQLGGKAMTKLVEGNLGGAGINDRPTSIWILFDGTLTGSQNLTYDLSSNSLDRVASLYHAESLGSFDAHDAQSNSGSSTTSLTVNIDIPEDGLLIAGASSGAGTTQTCSWTGVTEEYDINGTDGNAPTQDMGAYGGDADSLSSENNRTVTSTWGASQNDATIAAVSLVPYTAPTLDYSESVSAQVDLTESTSDDFVPSTISYSESVDAQVDLSPSISLTVSLGFDVSGEVSLSPSIATSAALGFDASSQVELTGSISFSLTKDISISSQVDLTEGTTFEFQGSAQFDAEAQVDLTADVAQIFILNFNVSAQVDLTEETAQSFSVEISLSAEVSLTETVSETYGYGRAVSSLLELTDTIDTSIGLGFPVSSQVDLTSDISFNISLGFSVSSQIDLTINVILDEAYDEAVSASIDLTESVTWNTSLGFPVSAQLDLTETILSNVGYDIDISGQVDLSPSIAFAFEQGPAYRRNVIIF